MAVEIVQLELKYCERCGGLWVRPRGAQTVYCAACVAQTSEAMPRPSRRKSRPRLPMNRDGAIHGQGLMLVSHAGGNA